jgi:hypothetical protein
MTVNRGTLAQERLKAAPWARAAVDAVLLLAMLLMASKLFVR